MCIIISAPFFPGYLPPPELCSVWTWNSNFPILATASCASIYSSRTRFMLETINALRNNNIRKIPNYDPAPLERARKIFKNIAGVSLYSVFPFAKK